MSTVAPKACVSTNTEEETNFLNNFYREKLEFPRKIESKELFGGDAVIVEKIFRHGVAVVGDSYENIVEIFENEEATEAKWALSALLWHHLEKQRQLEYIKLGEDVECYQNSWLHCVWNQLR